MSALASSTLVPGRLQVFQILTLQSADDGDLEVEILGGLDDSLGDDVATHDASEDVDEDGVHLARVQILFDFYLIGIGRDNLEGLRDLLDCGAATDIEEIGGLSSVEFDDVHGGHGESGSVDHAADISVEVDVVEVGLGSSDLQGVLLLGVLKSEKVWLTEFGVGVE